MSWFGKLELSWKFSLVLAGAIVVVLIAGFIRVWLDRREMARYVKEMEVEKGRTVDSDDRHLNKRELGPADLFGIQAIEAGFFGGVVQSRPPSAMPSGMNTPMHPASILGPGSRFLGDVNQKLFATDSDQSTLSVSSSLYGARGPRLPYEDYQTSPSQSQIRAGALQPSDTELSGGFNHGDISTLSIGSNFTMGSFSSPRVGSEALAPGLYDPSRPPSDGEQRARYQDRESSGSSPMTHPLHYESDTSFNQPQSPPRNSGGRSLT